MVKCTDKIFPQCDTDVYKRQVVYFRFRSHHEIVFTEAQTALVALGPEQSVTIRVRKYT